MSRWPRLMRRETLAEYIDRSTDYVDGLRKEGKMGGRVSRLKLYYEQRPRGGFLNLSLGRVKLGRVSTRGPAGRGGVQTIRFKETSRTLRLEHGGGGVVR